jgi:hypothetical protein
MSSMPEVKEYEHREILDELWNVRLYGECFDKYDVNKVYSIMYSATGISGDTIRSIALNILEYFVEYVDECEPCYIPMNSTEPMLHPSVVRDMYQYLVEHTITNGVMEKEVMVQFLCDKVDEYNTNRLNRKEPIGFLQTHSTSIISAVLVGVIGLSVYFYVTRDTKNKK